MSSESAPPAIAKPGLKKIAPYWYPYTTMAKGRWFGRELLEIVSTEFRDRSMEFYRYALESGVTTVNGQPAKPDLIIRNGDRIENVVHKHEPPVTSTPVKVLFEDPDHEYIVVNKPGSIPVHATGRYFRNSLIEILQDSFGYKKVYTINRLDRLTSGLMIIPLNSRMARKLTLEFTSGTVQKEYVARCLGKFPEGEVICEEPLLTVDRQMGLNIVHPEGKHAKTVFKFIRYDANTDTSVIHCRPLTGRSHQIRVHLQFLGHPVANDSVYSETKIWGPQLGKGGVDIVPTDERIAPAPLPHVAADTTSASGSTPSRTHGLAEQKLTKDPDAAPSKLMPRETGEDIGMGSPVPLSLEAVGIITRLRNMKDEDEDWSRWRDVVFHAKGALTPKEEEVSALRKPLPPHNQRKRGGPAFSEESKRKWSQTVAADLATVESPQPEDASPPPEEASALPPPVPQLTPSEALEKATELDATTATTDGMTYCPECYMPLHPDPKPEKLYIFLHALRYTTSLGSFETEMPEWTAEGWTWDRD
ncbi:hypothetical protein PLICRDRAFT_48438 [Plicaturopsis crispa FD-325 SS-3]|nr:hypothetical protein PLICRDRAFT_48438 [Plicaturopsis crispa FD-325 SS-3]